MKVLGPLRLSRQEGERKQYTQGGASARVGRHGKGDRTAGRERRLKVRMDGSDVALVARAKDGDEDAFRELVEKHARNVFRLAFRLTGNEEDAEDVVQESFLKAYRSLPRFEGKSEFGSWLFRITTNCAYDTVRRRERRRADALPGADDTAGPELASTLPSPERAAAGAELARKLKKAMARLSASERTAFVLRHFEGRSIVEIASALGIRTGATKTCVFRAVTKIRSALEASS
jgi:RNA polymerase sigma-70 factor, ECF subfamily